MHTFHSHAQHIHTITHAKIPPSRPMWHIINSCCSTGTHTLNLLFASFRLPFNITMRTNHTFMCVFTLDGLQVYSSHFLKLSFQGHVTTDAFLSPRSTQQCSYVLFSLLCILIFCLSLPFPLSLLSLLLSAHKFWLSCSYITSHLPLSTSPSFTPSHPHACITFIQTSPLLPLSCHLPSALCPLMLSLTSTHSAAFCCYHTHPSPHISSSFTLCQNHVPFSFTTSHAFTPSHHSFISLLVYYSLFALFPFLFFFFLFQIIFGALVFNISPLSLYTCSILMYYIDIIHNFLTSETSVHFCYPCIVHTNYILLIFFFRFSLFLFRSRIALYTYPYCVYLSYF